MRLRQLELATNDLEATLAFLKAIAWPTVPVSIQDQIILQVEDESSYGVSIRVYKDKAKGELSPLAYFESQIPLLELRSRLTEIGLPIVSPIQALVGYGNVLVAEDAGGLKLGFYESKFTGPRPLSSR